MKTLLLAGLLPLACLVQEIDLRTPSEPQPLVETCPDGQRWVPERGCVDCVTKEHPLVTCPCGWEFQPADLPYCDTDEAYYACLPCAGDIESCNAYDSSSGTSRDCFLLHSCCTQLADDPGSTACCDEPDLLRCVVDTAAGYEGAQHLVGCLPADCCDPACHPSLEVCDVVANDGQLVCVCNEVIAP